MQPSRRYLPGLDALRGVAAMAVMLMHGSYNFHARMMSPHGYLAVDFFFMLSGFVMAHAYGERMRGGLRGGELIVARVRRLYPLVIAGIGVGIVASVVAGEPWRVIAASAVSGAMLMPTVRGDEAAGLFPIDPPLWTLFWEMVASMAFARLLWRLSTRRLIVVQASAFALLAWLAAQHGTMEIGFERRHILGGAARIGFGFTTGMILHRWWLRRPGGADAPSIGWLAAALVMALSVSLPVPRIAFDLLVTALAFPIIILAAANVERVTPAWAIAATLSYPLYATHIPVLRMIRQWQEIDARIAPDTALALGIVLSGAVAWLALMAWDRPVQAWLAPRRGRRSPIAAVNGQTGGDPADGPPVPLAPVRGTAGTLASLPPPVDQLATVSP